MAGRECRQPATTSAPDASYGSLHNAAAFVRAQHVAMGERVLDYRLLPHHHMPSPFLAEPFAAIDRDEILRYDLVLDSVCLSVENGRLKRQIMKRDVWPLYEPHSDEVLQ